MVNTKFFLACGANSVKIVNIETLMSPCILLGGRPVVGIETKAEESGCEEGVGEGQHPGVHGPHQG